MVFALSLGFDFVSLYAIFYSYRFLYRVWSRPLTVDGKAVTKEIIEELLREAPHNEHRTVKAIYTDRLGNHVFQYCYARMFAMLVGAKFEAGTIKEPFDSLPTKLPADPTASTLFFENNVPYSRDTSPRSRGKSFGVRKRANESFPVEENDDYHQLLKDWLQYPVSNYAQDLYILNIDLIKHWVKSSVDRCFEKSGSNVPEFEEGELVIHVRLGDILWVSRLEHVLTFFCLILDPTSSYDCSGSSRSVSTSSFQLLSRSNNIFSRCAAFVQCLVKVLSVYTFSVPLQDLYQRKSALLQRTRNTQ